MCFGSVQISNTCKRVEWLDAGYSLRGVIYLVFPAIFVVVLGRIWSALVDVCMLVIMLASFSSFLHVVVVSLLLRQSLFINWFVNCWLSTNFFTLRSRSNFR